MESGKPYTSAECQFIEENYLRLSDGQIAIALKRTPSSIGTKRAHLGLFRKPKRTSVLAGRIAEMWPTMSGNKIAQALGCSHTAVMQIAAHIGLPKRTRQEAQYLTDKSEVVKPSKPRGFTRAELAWARKYNGYLPEAGLILVMARDSGEAA